MYVPRCQRGAVARTLLCIVANVLLHLFRSILLAEFEGVPYCLVAMGDGSLFYFHVHLKSGLLTEKKKVGSIWHCIVCSGCVWDVLELD